MLHVKTIPYDIAWNAPRPLSALDHLRQIVYLDQIVIFTGSAVSTPSPAPVTAPVAPPVAAPVVAATPAPTIAPTAAPTPGPVEVDLVPCVLASETIVSRRNQLFGDDKCFVTRVPRQQRGICEHALLVFSLLFPVRVIMFCMHIVQQGLLESLNPPPSSLSPIRRRKMLAPWLRRTCSTSFSRASGQPHRHGEHSSDMTSPGYSGFQCLCISIQKPWYNRRLVSPRC